MNFYVSFAVLVIVSCASAQLPSDKPEADFTLDLSSDGNSVITDGNGDFTEMSFEDFMFNLERDFQRITGELCRECFGVGFILDV